MQILDYFFKPIPGSPFRFYIPLLIFAVLLIAGGIFMLRELRKKKEDRAFKKLFSGIPRTCFWSAAILLINLAARYERFPIVGSRFLLYGILGFICYKGIRYVLSWQKKLPKLQEQFKETPVQKKYTTQKWM